MSYKTILNMASLKLKHTTNSIHLTRIYSFCHCPLVFTDGIAGIFFFLLFYFTNALFWLSMTYLLLGFCSFFAFSTFNFPTQTPHVLLMMPQRQREEVPCATLIRDWSYSSYKHPHQNHFCGGVLCLIKEFWVTPLRRVGPASWVRSSSTERDGQRRTWASRRLCGTPLERDDAGKKKQTSLV